MRPEARTCSWKIRPAPRRPGKSCTWSVMRAPAESTRYTTGCCSTCAASMVRMIFSTVLAPHEPALTVESFAMTRTGRPCTVAVPHTTPSAGRVGSGFAHSASSVNESTSARRRMRSRAWYFPAAAAAKWYFSAPPREMLSRSAR